MRLGSWLLGFGGRIGGVGACDSEGKLDMALEEGEVLVWREEREWC